MNQRQAAGASVTDPWEAAYLRFETPEQECRKFIRRLIKAGAADWPRDAKVVELFCGRGNGLRALSQLGFTQLEGVDLSASLIAQYQGVGQRYVGDCRYLPFADDSRDRVIIQGGLHHLLSIEDLERTLLETNRILKNDGLFFIVEPWLTPFLSFTHAVCRLNISRRMSTKIDALATMIHYERQTYEDWLSRPKIILSLLHKYFAQERCSLKWGKLTFVGRKKETRGRKRQLVTAS